MPWARGDSDGSPIGVGAERIEVRGQMPETPDRLGQVRGADDDVESGMAPLDGGMAGCRPASAGIGRRPGFERLAGRGVDRLGILPVSLVQLENVPGIDSRELVQIHNLPIVPCLDPRTQASGTAGT